MTAGIVAGVVLAFLVGSLLQRVSGQGMGLVAAPTLTVLIGPVAGVAMTNVAAAVTATLVWVAMREHVDRGRLVAIVPLIVVGSVVGAFFVGGVPTAWLDVVIGGTVLVAMAVSVQLQRFRPAGGAPVAMAAGAAAGFMNTTAGVAAPAMTAYALATRWEQRSFAATLQPVWVTANLSSVGAKWGTGALGDGGAPWWLWPLGLAGVLAGVLAGAALAHRVSSALARRLAISVAVVGALVALGRGLLAL